MKIDARIVLLSIILLSLALGIADERHVPGVLFIGCYIGILYRKYLIQAVWVVAGAVMFIFFIGVLSWLFTSEINWVDFVLDSFRWVVLVLSTFVLIASMNLFEFLAAMVYFKIPVKVAIALGVGIRFLPVILEECRRISIISKRNSQFERLPMIVKTGKLLSSFIISVIRRIDSITLSIITQQLEERISSYEFRQVGYYDFIHIGICILFFVYMIAY